MQPEQQTQTPQTSSNVPDYLGMEPINNQKPKRVNKIFGVLVGLIIIALVGLGGLFGWSWLQGESERQFYLAIENTMRAEIVSRTLTQTNHDPSSLLSVMAISDFSTEGTSKSSVEFDFSYMLPSKKTFRLIGAEKVLNEDGVLFSLSKYPDIVYTKNIEKDLWYSMSNDDDESMEIYDPLDLRYVKNTFIPGIPVGIVSGDGVVSLMKTSKTFNIVSRDSEVIDGKQAHVFVLSSTYSKLKELDNKIASITKLSADSIFAKNGKNTVSYKLWVDDATNRIVKARVDTKTSLGADIATYEVNVTYPSTSSITEPDLINSLSSEETKS